jgi:hypothetical protein
MCSGDFYAKALICLNHPPEFAQVGLAIAALSRPATRLSALAPAQRAGAQRLRALAHCDDTKMSNFPPVLAEEPTLGVMRPAALSYGNGIDLVPRDAARALACRHHATT